MRMAKQVGVKGVFVIAVLIGATGLAAAQDSAAPPAKPVKADRGPSRPAPPLAMPQQFAPPQEAYASLPEASAAAQPSQPSQPSACQLRLAKIAAFQPLPVLVGAGDCGATDAVLLQTITLSDQTKVTVAPPATLRCTMAEEITHWVREDVAPAAVKLGAALRDLDDFDSYECRGRNRVRGATLSEHGRANALDVRDFKLADGQTVGLTDVNVDKDWRESIKATVCARFSTVLGPGSDGNHEEHIHLDLAERHNNYKLCEWDVRVPPPPPPPQETKPPAEGGASKPEEATAEQTALIPLDMVPLPRPRPAAEIEKATHRSAIRRSSFDAPLGITPQ
jgi:hypothetical protein